LAQVVVTVVLVWVGIAAPERLLQRYKVSDLISYIIAFSAILVVNILIELTIMSRRFHDAKKTLAKNIEAAESRLGQRIHAIEIDPTLSRFRDTARRLLAPCSGLDILLHEWLWVKAQEITDIEHYKENFSGSTVGMLEENARVDVLTKVLLNAKKSVTACTYADADHLRIFGENPSSSRYIRAHGDALRRTPPLDVKRVFIVPPSATLPIEAKKNLLSVANQFLREGMTQNYWVSEEDAKLIFHNRADVTFPERGFFLADHEVSATNAHVAFVSEGLSHDEMGNVKDRPYFVFTKDRRSLTPFALQFELLLSKAKERQLNNSEAINHLAAHIGLAQKKAPRD